MSGYIRLHRTLIGHPAFRNDAEAMAFAWMVARAAWQPVRVRYKGRPVQLERGQVSVSQRDMAAAMDRDKAWVERLWKRLRAEAMIEVVCEAGVAVVTICNYDEYQPSGAKREAVTEAPDKADARQTQGTEQRREEGKKETNTPLTPRKRGNDGKSFIPENWEAPHVSDLPPRSQACAKLWTPASYATEAEAFFLYWRGERKMKADWRGTWANRVIARHSAVMRDQKFGNAPTEAKQDVTPTTLRERAEWFDRIGNRDSAAECRNKAAQLEQRAA